MKEVGIFLGKLSLRFLILIGVVPAARSRPVRFFWHSPPLAWLRQWLPMVVLVMVLGLTATQQLPSFEIARRLVLSKPYDYWAHLRLAEAAVLTSDYELAVKELTEVERLLALAGNDQVLGTVDDVDQVRNLIFPESSMAEEIATLEQTLRERPGYRDVALRLALLYWRLGNTLQAENYLQQAEAADPNSTLVEMVRGLVRGTSE